MDIDVQILITEFERDMQFDCHCNMLKVSRSDAAKELFDRGKSALPHIVRHLLQNPPNQQLEIHICWGMLLCSIARKLDSREKPTTYKDIEGWIAWAKKETA